MEAYTNVRRRKVKKPTTPQVNKGSTVTESNSRKKKTQDLAKRVKELPKKPGTYLMKNAMSKVIYVGKAREIRTRVRNYFTQASQKNIKTQYLVSQIDSIDYMVTDTEEEAFLLEASLIKKYRPKYNIRLKDDKSFPYIRCSTAVDYPKFDLCRKVKNDGATYFGPYTSGSSVRDTIQFVNRTYKLRDCTDSFMKSTKRPCMTYQMGHCTAPCVDYVTKGSYQKSIQWALDFLRGRDNEILSKLKFGPR